MAGKDSNDMTASEMLRLAAGEGEQGGWTGTVRKLAYIVGISNLRICELNNCDLLDESYKVIADKIDAELAQARRSGLERAAKSWAKANGWPDFREGEDFGAWLERCAIPRPRFEDGEPVQFGELVSSDLFGAVKVSAIEFTEDGTHVKDEPDGDWSTSLEVTTSRLKRPVPEALGADEKPIVNGETAYRIDRPITEIKILYIRSYDDGSSDVVYCEGDPSLTKMCDPSLITHTPPETQERIDDDATMPPAEYCAVRGIYLGDDPDRETATVSMVRDLLRRQRELDKRTGGDA